MKANLRKMKTDQNTKDLVDNNYLAYHTVLLHIPEVHLAEHKSEIKIIAETELVNL